MKALNHVYFFLNLVSYNIKRLKKLEFLNKKRFKIKRSINNDQPYRENNEDSKHKSNLVINLDLQSGTILNSKKNKQKESKDKVQSILKINTNDWDSEDRKKLLDAIIRYGNDFNNENVGKIRTNSTSRHSQQKFLVKLKKKNIFDLNIDLGKSSCRKLNEIGKTLNSEFYLKTIKNLKFVAFERKSNFLMQSQDAEILWIQNKNIQELEENIKFTKNKTIIQNDVKIEEEEEAM